jgi:hypothetical protein
MKPIGLTAKNVRSVPPCDEQGSSSRQKKLKLPERVKNMPEQKSGYMQEVDAWLTEVLMDVKSGESEEQWLARVKPLIKQKLLQSYRNGQAAGPAKRSLKPRQK